MLKAYFFQLLLTHYSFWKILCSGRIKVCINLLVRSLFLSTLQEGKQRCFSLWYMHWWLYVHLIIFSLLSKELKNLNIKIMTGNTLVIRTVEKQYNSIRAFSMKHQRGNLVDYFLSNIKNAKETIRICNSKLKIHN